MHRCLSRHAGLPGADAGGGLYDIADVHGADLRYNFRAVWLVARCHYAGAVFGAGGGGGCKRGCTHPDCECILSAATPASTGRRTRTRSIYSDGGWCCKEGLMMRNILVGYDGSEAAVHALTFATELARVLGSSLHVLAVVRPP